MSPNNNIILLIVSQRKQRKNIFAEIIEEEMCREYISDMKGKTSLNFFWASSSSNINRNKFGKGE